MFDEAETNYLQTGGLARLARLATVDSEGQPTVDSVGFSYDAGQFIVGTHTGDVTSTRKGRNVNSGKTKVSLIVDDLRSVDPLATTRNPSARPSREGTPRWPLRLGYLPRDATPHHLVLGPHGQRLRGRNEAHRVAVTEPESAATGRAAGRWPEGTQLLSAGDVHPPGVLLDDAPAPQTSGTTTSTRH